MCKDTVGKCRLFASCFFLILASHTNLVKQMAKLHICLILLSLIFANVYCQDKCALPANHEGIWRGTPFQVSSCFNSIPESAITKTKTLNIVEDLWKVYSFSDPYQANLPPFNINVCLLEFEFSIP